MKNAVIQLYTKLKQRVSIKLRTIQPGKKKEKKKVFQFPGDPSRLHPPAPSHRHLLLPKTLFKPTHHPMPTPLSNDPPPRQPAFQGPQPSSRLLPFCFILNITQYIN